MHKLSLFLRDLQKFCNFQGHVCVIWTLAPDKHTYKNIHTVEMIRGKLKLLQPFVNILHDYNFIRTGGNKKEWLISVCLSVVLLHETSFLRLWSSSTSPCRSTFTDPSKEGLMHSRIVNCSEMFMWKSGLTITTSIWTVSLIQWNDKILHSCNLIGPLNFFQARKDCDEFRIATGTSPLLRYRMALIEVHRFLFVTEALGHNGGILIT